MRNRQKILIFSDCFTYSGSELVIENLMLSKKICESFDLEFIYGFNHSYDKRLKERFNFLDIKDENVRSIKLISPDWVSHQKRIITKRSASYVLYFLLSFSLKVLKFLFISHIFNFIKLRKYFLKSNPDILFVNNGGYPASLQCITAIFVARSIGIKKIFLNINNMAMARKRWYDSYIDSFIGRNVTKFVTASFAAQKQAVITRKFEKQSFVRIPNTIYNDHQIDFQYKKNENRKQIKFGSVGLLTQRKGFHILLKAIDILVNQNKFTDFALDIIGDGEDRSYLENLVTKYNINKYVNFLGFKSNPMLNIPDFDVFILPSVRNEDFPYVILEAMIFAKPIIGTYVAGIPEQIDNNQTGILIEPNNPEQLANAMAEMLSKEKIVNYGLKSRDKYFNEFSYENMENKYFDLFSLNF